MRNRLLINFLAVAVAVPMCVVTILAQDQASGQRARRPVLARVLQSLNLSADQKSQIVTIRQQQKAKIQDLNSQSLTQAQYLEARKTIETATRQRIVGVLTPEQKATLEERIAEVRHQMAHPGFALALRGVNLTADQKAQIKTIRQQQRPKIEALDKQSLTRQQYAAQRQAIAQATQQQIEQLLTPDQKTLLQERLAKIQQRFGK